MPLWLIFLFIITPQRAQRTQSNLIFSFYLCDLSVLCGKNSLTITVYWKMLSPYVSSGTAPGRDGPSGAVDLITLSLYCKVFTHEQLKGKDR